MVSSGLGEGRENPVGSDLGKFLEDVSSAVLEVEPKEVDDSRVYIKNVRECLKKEGYEVSRVDEGTTTDGPVYHFHIRRDKNA